MNIVGPWVIVVGESESGVRFGIKCNTKHSFQLKFIARRKEIVK